jgi:hypothetical protein
VGRWGVKKKVINTEKGEMWKTWEEKREGQHGMYFSDLSRDRPIREKRSGWGGEEILWKSG